MASVKWDGGKYKGATEAKAHFRHNGREAKEYGNTDIDKSRTHLNFSAIGRSYQERCKMYDDAIIEAQTHSKRALRSDAVTCLGLVTYPPAELPEDKLKEWYTKVHGIMIDTFGAENVIDTDVHYDERHEYLDPVSEELVMSKVHSHTLVVPRTKDGRLCCKEIYTKENIINLNSAIEDMTQRDYGVQFQTGAKVKGKKKVEELKAETLRATLEEEERAINHRHELVVKNTELSKRNTELEMSMKTTKREAEADRESARKEREEAERERRRAEQERKTAEQERVRTSQRCSQELSQAREEARQEKSKIISEARQRASEIISEAEQVKASFKRNVKSESHRIENMIKSMEKIDKHEKIHPVKIKRSDIYQDYEDTYLMTHPDDDHDHKGLGL